MFPRIVTAALFVAAFAAPAMAQLARTPAPAGATVYFIAPAAGATVTSPVTVKFGLTGMGVAPAGTEMPNTGHHHLLIDSTLASEGEAIPKDGQHLHFGGGQTETRVELTPGTHTLQLVLGDKNHIPFEPSIKSEAITITVK